MHLSYHADIDKPNEAWLTLGYPVTCCSFQARKRKRNGYSRWGRCIWSCRCRCCSRCSRWGWSSSKTRHYTTVRLGALKSRDWGVRTYWSNGTSSSWRHRFRSGGRSSGCPVWGAGVSCEAGHEGRVSQRRIYLAVGAGAPVGVAVGMSFWSSVRR